jgi:DNA/RNA-binding domain of Phe-tRNA-synthetase-like protein
MPFVVAEDCVRLGLRAGAVAFRGVRVGPAGPGLRAEVAEEVAAVRQRFADPAAVRADPQVSGFFEVLRRVGVNPRRGQPSIARLLAYALKRGDLPVVNSLVDAYNLVSVRSLCSLGAHDLDRITLPASLRLLTGREPFTPLGGEAAAVRAGEFGYVDGGGAVLCRLDVVQADFSKVTSDTANALLIIEGTVAHPPAALRRAFADAVDVVLRHCGGTAEVVAFPYPDEDLGG